MCIPHHDGPYPLQLGAEINPFPSSCFCQAFVIHSNEEITNTDSLQRSLDEHLAEGDGWERRGRSIIYKVF